MVSIYCNCVCHWLGKAFLWPFSVPINRRSHLKKQSRDLDVVGRVKNGTCQARVFLLKRCPISMSKFTTTDVFFVNMNKSGDHIHNRHVGPTMGSSFPITERKFKRQANHERLSCAQSSQFILFFVQ